MGCSKNLNVQEFSWIDLHFFQVGYENKMQSGKKLNNLKSWMQSQ